MTDETQHFTFSKTAEDLFEMLSDAILSGQPLHLTATFSADGSLEEWDITFNTDKDTAE